MNKEEILKRSRNENKAGDERQKSLEQRSSQNAYIAIMGVFLLLAIIALFQEITTGSAFIDSRICSLVFIVGIAAISLSCLYIFRLIWS